MYTGPCGTSRSTGRPLLAVLGISVGALRTREVAARVPSLVLPHALASLDVVAMAPSLALPALGFSRGQCRRAALAELRQPERPTVLARTAGLSASAWAHGHARPKAWQKRAGVADRFAAAEPAQLVHVSG